MLSAGLTFALEAGTVLGAPWPIRSLISLLCLLFDVFFLLELAARGASAFAEGRLSSYIRHGGGWRDFLAAVLPLVFSTGPFLFGGIDGLANTATVTALGSFRLLRGLGLLRLLRLIRLFPGDSPSGNGIRIHGSTASKAALLALASSLAVLILAEIASIAGFWPDAHAALATKREATLKALASNPSADGAELVALADEDLLLVRYQGRVVFTRYSAEEYHRRFGPDEIGYLRRGTDPEAFFSLTSEVKAQAASTLASGISGLAILLAIAWGCLAGKGGLTTGAGQEMPVYAQTPGTVPHGDTEILRNEPIGSEEFEGLLGLPSATGQEKKTDL